MPDVLQSTIPLAAGGEVLAKSESQSFFVR
jgi:hypothetical protein